MAKTEKKLIANNKKAYHDYFILEKYEAGLVLHGTEVKSLRMGKCSIKEAFIRVEDGEMYIYGMHISPYEKGNIFNKDPLRVRKLLLHKKEILKIFGKMKEQGITVVPLQVYFSGSLVKIEIGLAKGKKLTSVRRSQRKIRSVKRRENSKRSIDKGLKQERIEKAIGSETNCFFYFIDIASKYKSTHSGFFCCIDVWLKIINKETFFCL